MIRKTKYLIVGQGIVGTWMSYFLSQAGIDFVVVNDENSKAASWVASGVINPVTGRRIVQTWIIDEVLPFAVEHYTNFEKLIKCSFFKKSPIILLHPSAQMKDSFDFRLNNDNVYLSNESEANWQPYFNLTHGTGKIEQGYWIDLQKMIIEWRNKIETTHQYINDSIATETIILSEQCVIWKNIEAEYIVYCDGIQSQQNPFFSYLPFAPNKGEALIAQIPSLPSNFIYKSSYSIVPWNKDQFWIGSNYQWNYDNNLPTISFKENVTTFLQQTLKIPYTIVDHIVGIRPANIERRPFVGLHPKHPRVAICNGMGTKGCSLAPYFSKQLIDYIELGKPIHSEATIERFQF